MAVARERAAIALLAAFMLINFWDRAAFGFAAKPIMRDLHLSATEFGMLGGIFFALFAPAAILVGWLADRWPARWLLGCMALVWALAQTLMAFAGRLPQVLASRVLLGAGEGPALPGALHEGYSHVTSASRPMVTAAVNLGAPLGIASGAIFITLITSRFGWRTAFAALSCISFAWSIAWFATQRSRKPAVENTSRSEPRRHRLSLNSTTVGLVVAAFCVYWVLALAVNWFPTVLQVANGLSPIAAAQFLTVAWGLQTFFFPLAARASASLRRSGRPSEVAFAAPAACALALCGISLLSFGVVPSAAALALIALALWSGAVAFTCLPPILLEVVPTLDRGTALGAFAGFSSTAGIVAPFVFGRIVDVAGGGAPGYRLAVAVSGVLLSVAAPIAFALIRPTRHRVESATN